MPNGQRWTMTGERTCLAVLFVWLFCLPLPFGSVVEEARLPLIAVPLALCFLATLLRLYATRDRSNTARPTPPWTIWGIGALILIACVLMQLVPLPVGLLRLLSPQAETIWSEASRIAAIGGAAARKSFPLTIDPHATAFELMRITGMFAAFTTAALLIRSHVRRQVLAYTLSAAAIFEAFYGIREAALNRYAIWGWVNRLIFDRVTGTFVNPNHFGHYLAIVFPMTLFIVAVAWHRAGGRESTAAQRLANVLEYSLLAVGFAAIGAIACMSGILLSQSRGSLLALGAGLLVTGAMLPGRRVARIAAGAAGGLATVVALAIYLGPERTVARFIGSTDAVASRRVGLSAAGGIWQRFPVFGSGAGTFERVVSMEQGEKTEVIYHHAHNDFAEMAATTGALGFMIAAVTLLGGYAALQRMTFGEWSGEITWSRRAFQVAALGSLTIAMIHALFDFNFYIPANPATLAVIAGASVASLDHDKRIRR
jgi:O-antigen ligase